MLGSFLRTLFSQKVKTSQLDIEKNKSVLSKQFEESDTISGAHPLRDKALGFFDSPAVRRQLFQHLKDRSNDVPAFVIALDAKNLGSLNTIMGQEHADKIWGAYAGFYIDTLVRAFPHVNAICGFRDVGDEAQIVLSGKNITYAKIEKALKQAEDDLREKFSALGLDKLPAGSSDRSAGFGLHYAVRQMTDFKIDSERLDTYEPSFQDQFLIPELSIAKTVLNTEKPKVGGEAVDSMTPEAFIQRYKTTIEQHCMSDKAERFPVFLWPKSLEMDSSLEGSQKELSRQRRDFWQSAPEDTYLLRFDMSGMRYLNKNLSHVKIETILSRLPEIVEHHFRLLGTQKPVWFEILYAGSGIVDVNIPKDMADAFTEEDLAHINETLNFHLMNNLIDTAAFRNHTDKEKQLYQDLPKQFAFIMIPVVAGNPDETLRRADEAMDQEKLRLKTKVAVTNERTATNDYFNFDYV